MDLTSMLSFSKLACHHPSCRIHGNVCGHDRDGHDHGACVHVHGVYDCVHGDHDYDHHGAYDHVHGAYDCDHHDLSAPCGGADDDRVVSSHVCRVHDDAPCQNVRDQPCTLCVRDSAHADLHLLCSIILR